MANKFIPIFYDWLEDTQDLSQEEKGNLIDAVVAYSAGMEYEHLLTGGCRIAFRFMKGQIDRNAAISESRSRAGSSRKKRGKGKADPNALSIEPEGLMTESAGSMPDAETDAAENAGSGFCGAEASDINPEQAKANGNKTEQTKAKSLNNNNNKNDNNNENENKNENEDKNENKNEDETGYAGAGACASPPAGAAAKASPKAAAGGKQGPVRIREQDDAPPREIEERFTRFWAAYPRKEAKQKAHAVFLRLKPDEEMLQGMLKALDRQKACDQWQEAGGKFVPHPTTWLSGRRWEDEPPKAGSGFGKTVLAQRYDQRDYRGAQETPEEMMARLTAAQT